MSKHKSSEMQKQHILNYLTTKKEAVQKVCDGQRYSEVARMFDVSRTTIKNWCASHGVYSNNKGFIPMDVRVENDIVDLVKYGANYEDVAREHHVSVKLVTKICKRHGVFSERSILLKKKKRNES